MIGPSFAFVDVSTGWRTPTGRTGARAAHHQLRCAYAVAALRDAGVRAQPIVQRRLGPLPGLVADLARAGADIAVLWDPEPTAPAVNGLAALLAADLPGLRVLRAGAGTALGDELEAPLLALAAGGEPVAKPAEDVADLPSPWLDAVVPASAAAVVGVELDRPGVPLRRHATARTVAEIAWIDARAIEPVEVMLHGDGPAREPAVIEELLAGLARDRLRRVTLALRGGRDPTAGLLAALAATGGGRVVVEFSAEEEPDAAVARIRAWQDAGAAAGVAIDIIADLPAEPPEPDALEGLLARIGPEAPGLRYTWRPAVAGAPPRRPARLACPELAGTPGFRDESALERAVLARLLRAHEGLYPDAAGYADGVIDVVWASPDAPADHAAWLAGLLSPTSLLFVDGPAGHLAAPGPVAELWGVTPESDKRRRLDAGDAIDIAPYSHAASHHAEVPLVLTWSDRADAEALLADADEAHRTGVLPSAMLSGLTRLQDGVLWLAPDNDPSPRLARLWVGGDGTVAPGPAAERIGAIGDAFERLLDASGRRPAPASLPSWLDPEELSRWHAAKPWLVAFAAACQALRRVAAVVGPAAVGDLRLSGLGGRLHYDGDGTPAPAARHVLLRAGDADLLLDPVSGRLSRLKTEVAAAWEALACTHDAAAAAAWLAGRPGGDARRARAVVANVAVRLAPSLQPPMRVPLTESAS